jgi:serine/threonine-protein kinase RsbW
VTKPTGSPIGSLRMQETNSCLEIEARIPSEVKAISPLLDQLMHLIEESRCVAGEELSVELALREALNNAVLHGNRLDPSKLVCVYCRCELGKELSVLIKDQGGGFDPSAPPDPLAVENLQAEHGRGILLMRSQMDEVSFGCGGREVRMRKRVSAGRRTMPEDSGQSDQRCPADDRNSQALQDGKRLAPMETPGGNRAENLHH